MARSPHTKSTFSSMAPYTIQHGYRYEDDNDTDHNDDESTTVDDHDGVLEAHVERIQIAKQLSFKSSQNNTSGSSFPPSIITVSTQQQPTEKLEVPATRPRSTCLPFQIEKYDNVLHHWNNKPFVKDRIRTFFGSCRQDRMEQKVSDTQQSISRCGDATVWDPEGLVLTDVSRPFQSKLLLSVSHTTEELYETHKIKHVSGTWLSRVYCGNYGNCFLDWIDDLTDYCKAKYDKVIHPPRDFYVYYPSESQLQTTQFKGDSLVVFFVKLED